MSDKHRITGLDAETDDKILEGVNRIAEFAEANARTTGERVEKIDEKVEKAEGKIEKAKDAILAKLEERDQIYADKLERMERRQVATGKLSLVDTTDVLLAALDDDEKKDLSFIEQSMTSHDKGRMREPVFKLACSKWFQHATRVQLKAFSEQHRHCIARLDVLSRAFSDLNRVKATITTLSDAVGGYLVPDPVAAEINRLIEDNSVMRPLVRKITMTTKTLDLPKKGDAVTAAIVAENGTIGDGIGASPFAVATLTAKKFCALANASIESIQDAAPAILDFVRTNIAEEIAQLEDTEALEGNGTHISGLASDTGVNEIAAGDNGDDITYQKLVDTVFKAQERASRNAARWFMAPEAMAKIVGMRAEEYGTDWQPKGMPIFQFANVPGQIAPTLLGFPIELHSGILANRTKGSGTALTHIYFGPPTACVFGDRVGMSWDVTEAVGWTTYRVDMRLVKRTGIVWAVPKAMTRTLDLKTT